MSDITNTTTRNPLVEIGDQIDRNGLLTVTSILPFIEPVFGSAAHSIATLFCMASTRQRAKKQLLVLADIVSRLERIEVSSPIRTPDDIEEAIAIAIDGIEKTREKIKLRSFAKIIAGYCAASDQKGLQMDTQNALRLVSVLDEIHIKVLHIASLEGQQEKGICRYYFTPENYQKRMKEGLGPKPSLNMQERLQVSEEEIHLVSMQLMAQGLIHDNDSSASAHGLVFAITKAGMWFLSQIELEAGSALIYGDWK